MRNVSRGEEISRPQPRSKTSALFLWLAPLALILAAFLIQALASRHPQWVERYYARRFFPPIIRVLSLINGIVGFSLAEFMLAIVPISLVFTLLYQVLQIYRRRASLARMLRIDLLVLIW